MMNKQERRKSVISINNNNDDNDDYNDNFITSYCSRCEKANILQLLGERIYDENEVISGEDHDNWLQCHRCGTLVPKIHAKRETKLVGFVDLPDSPLLEANKKVFENLYTRKKSRNMSPISHNEIKDPDIQAFKNKGFKIDNITEY